MRAALRWLFAGLYGVVPFAVLLALWVVPLPATHMGRSFQDNVASALAIVGFALIFLEYLVICRVRFIANLFGCDRVMQTHQLFARTGAVFLVAHPFLYSLWGNIGRPGEHRADTLGLDGASLLSGGVAWGALIALVVLAIERHRVGRRYDRWRHWHAVLAAVVVVFGLHHTLHAGWYASIGWVATVWWIFFGVAVAIMLFLGLVRPALQWHQPYRVVSVQPVARQIWQLQLRAEGRKIPRPMPGQFFWLKRGTPWKRADHPFSLAWASRNADELAFLIKEAGEFSSALTQASPGERIYLDGPYGDFQIPDSAKTVVMIAGGIGIAPMISLLVDAVERGDTRQFLLLYATQTPDEQIDLVPITAHYRLARLTEERIVAVPDAHWIGAVGRCDGVFVVAACRRAGIHLAEPDLCCMVCGPAAMADSVEAALVSESVPMASIHTERYRYELGEDSPIARRSVRRWLAISLTMFLGLIVLAYQLSLLR